MPTEPITPVRAVSGVIYERDGSRLKPGDLFRGTVLENQGGQVTLRVGGGLVNARSELMLALGETSLFRIKGMEGDLLILQKQEAKMPETPVSQEKNWAVLLKELGLTDALQGEKVISHLLSRGLPLSRELIKQIMQGMETVPDHEKENMIKIISWLHAAKITDPELKNAVMKNLLNSTDTLKLLEKILENMNKGKEAAAPEMERLRGEIMDLITAQRIINQSRLDNPKLPELYYFPLPQQYPENKMPAQVYFALQNKNSSGFQNPLSIYLSLESENIGPLWFEVKVRENDLDIFAYAQERKAVNYLNSTWDILKDAIEAGKFRVNSFQCREKSIGSVFELAEDLGSEESYRWIDARI